MNLNFYSVLLLSADILSLILAYMSWKRRPAKGSKPLCVLMLSLTQWIICQYLYLTSTSHGVKIFWHEFKFLGIAVIPIALLFLVSEQTNRKNLIYKKNIIFYMIIPICTFIIIMTNNYHGLFRLSYDFVKIGDLEAITTVDGKWFWINMAYTYLLLLKGLLFLIIELIYQPKLFRNQSMVIVAGLMIPWLWNFLYIFLLKNVFIIDITPLAFLISGAVTFLGLFRYKYLDLVPIAKELVFDSIQDAAIVLDNHMRIVDINLSAKIVFEIDNDNVIGKSVHDILPKTVEINKDNNELVFNEDKISFQSGEIKKYFEVKSTLIVDKKNRKIGNQILLHDITERERILEEIEASRKKAEAANKAKSVFLANMSHEIRTPMNGILGMIDVMTSSTENEEQRKNLEIIKSSAESLLVIINDILDYSKIESGKMKLEKIDFNLKQLVSDSVKLFDFKGIEKGIKIKCELDEDIPDLLIGDPLRLRQIINNLISNAVKFTSEGSISTDVKIAKCFKDKIILRFIVKDTGIGIPKEKIDQLFKSFEQIDSSTTRKYGGTGLGLSIVKDLVELMNGCIKVESQINIGSSFIVDIPFVFSSKKTKVINENNEISNKEIDFKNISILIAEDNKVNQLIMMKMFKKNGLDVEIAENGKVVLQKIEQGSYDIVLMDVQMPILDGYETTKIIRERNIDIPIIALTANAMKSDREKCLESGMNDYISKPVKFQNVIEILKKYI